ncbi:PilT/PilU family type 4a pilus ATPase [Horticoccus luteus]|uniref:PilT/PilU family type 4a pilus ATPase n=1 Tax=Horticoccus luteus TaxID=2862869 RepID=A0A8F9XG10_9BACT|nr:PilT/PilU family type 4a pilus ATPase [Horticoccus luteus]QYM78652.1 PilT/PilU family type 4a pilus ATPase [Horticoccus luteus]
MNNEILWLVRLGLDQNLFTRSQAQTVRTALGDRCELMDYAQKLIDDAIVDDVETLEKLAGLAQMKGQKSAPADDPFDDAELDSASAAHRPADTPPPAKSSPTAPHPSFPFSTLATLDPAALAAGLRGLLQATARYGASDLHLSTGSRPFLRKNRRFSFLGDYSLTADDALRLNTALLSEGQKRTFLARQDYDYALAITATDRYRVNLMFHKDGVAGAYRMVPEKIRTLPELGFSAHLPTLHKLLSYHNGLILITGPVGSGKTTTLASMVAYLNETRTDHIITVEDPIEVVQPAKGCNVTQREVGPHTQSFFTALKGALREDPDVIVIGELRDLETIEMAITASETGHLVIATMHTSDAATTLTRLLDVFPPSQQTQIRASVAESLRGIVCQRLLPTPEGALVLACEILVSNVAIQSLIKEGKSTGLRNTMETGVKDGMCLMDNVVFSLYNDRQISAETALANLNNRVLRNKIT